MSATEILIQGFETVPWVAVVFAIGFFIKLMK